MTAPLPPLLLRGDCLVELARIPDESVDSIVTSPPYYGLRDYGHENQGGQEETPEAYVEWLTRVFEEVRVHTVGQGNRRNMPAEKFAKTVTITATRDR